MKKVFKILIIALVLLGVIFSLYIAMGVDFSLDRQLFISAKEQNPTRFFYTDENGESVEFYTIYNSVAKKQWVDMESVNPAIKMAFLATEDREFYTHPGFNIKRTALAFLNSIFHFRARFGASTITQQLIKNISGDNQNTVKRKLDEIIRAVHLETLYSKDEIFEMYLNIVPMGNGISGISLAAEYYFGKDQSELTLAEAALLVGITNSPRRYDPFTSPEKSIERRNVVLYASLDSGYITNEEYEASILEKLELNESRKSFDPVFPWFVETVLSDFSHDYASKNSISEATVRQMIINGGFEFYTTMDSRVQACLDEYFENLTLSEKSNGLKVGMCVFDAESGYLVGVIGNRGEKTASRIKNNTETLIIPGSAIKPLSLYAPLLDSGKYNIASVFDDSPVDYIERDGVIFEYPKNYPRVYDGYITLNDAAALSKNTVAARIFKLLDKKRVFKTLKEGLYFDSLTESLANGDGKTLSDISFAPLALGQLTRGVSLRSLSSAYGVFVNDGNYRQGISYTSVFSSNGKLIFENEQKTSHVFKSDTAKITALMLTDVLEWGTAKKITLSELYDVGGKTGTSGGDLDRVFVGFSPYYVAGIWCGYGDNKTAIGAMEVSHLEMWDRVMSEIHERTVKDETPRELDRQGLLYLPYCRDSGLIPTDACGLDLRGDRVSYGYFSRDSIPSGECKKHIICYFNENEGKAYLRENEATEYQIIALLDLARRALPIDLTVEDEKYSIYKYL